MVENFWNVRPLKILLLCCVLFVRISNIKCASNLVFVGVFPVHGKGDHAQTCGETILFERGLQRVEAMHFAIDQINQDNDVLKNIVIRPIFIDSCDQGNIAVERFVKDALQKIRGTTEESCSSSAALQGETMEDLYGGVIGAASSSVSMELANLLRLFKVPQISYASTSVLLNDRVRFKYFTRTVPPDTQQVNAMLDLASSLGWRSFSILYSEGSYGESAFEALRSMTQNEDDFCLMEHFKLNARSNFTRIVQTLQHKRHSNTSVIILFCQTEHIQPFLAALPIGHNFTLLASDFWGNKKKFLQTEHLKSVANGALTFKLPSPSIIDFVSYFQKLNVTNNKRNKWYKEYYDNITCHDNYWKCASRIIMYDDKVPYVIDAVYALAFSLDEIYREKCPLQNGICYGMKDSLGPRMLEKLFNLTYTSVFGRSMLNENGSANTGYSILRYHANTDQYEKVALWNGSITIRRPFPYKSSRCSSPCAPSERRKHKEGYPACCYHCEACPSTYYKVNDELCARCEADMRPNATGNGCVSIPVRHLPFKWVITIVLISAIGIVVTLAIILVFYYYKDTEIVRVSAPELSFPLLSGVVLLYSLIFVVVADQSTILCGFRRFGTGFFFSICFSAVLTKTNRLARVFNEKKYSKRAPRFLSATAQLIMMLILVCLEGAFATFALVLQPPSLLTIFDDDMTAGIVSCVIPTFDIIIALLYNTILLFVCVYYAYRTRKVPSCFNEAKHLGVVTYTTMLIWICFLPVHLIRTSEDTKIITFSISLFLSATSIVVFLFCPKIYIIIFRPARNKRAVSVMSFTTSQSQSMEQSEGYPRKMTTCSALSSTSKDVF